MKHKNIKNNIIFYPIPEIFDLDVAFGLNENNYFNRRNLPLGMVRRKFTMKENIKYKGWTISYNPKPIPCSKHDYDVTHYNYDGPESNLHFTCESITEAIQEIEYFEEECEDKRILKY